MFSGYPDSDLMQHYKLRCHILQKKSRSRNAFIRKEKFRVQISRKVKTLKAVKETVRHVYGPSLDNGNEQSFSFTEAWTKQNSKPYTEKKRYSRLCLFICYPLNPFVIFYAISIF